MTASVCARVRRAAVGVKKERTRCPSSATKVHNNNAGTTIGLSSCPHACPTTSALALRQRKLSRTRQVIPDAAETITAASQCSEFSHTPDNTTFFATARWRQTRLQRLTTGRRRKGSRVSASLSSRSICLEEMRSCSKRRSSEVVGAPDENAVSSLK